MVRILPCKEPGMGTPAGAKPGTDLRDYLAEERTFLAWIRTALALTGLGFVVARFGLFLEEIQAARRGFAGQSHWPSLRLRTAFIPRGVVVNLLSIYRHLPLVLELNRMLCAFHPPSQQAGVLA